jgi:hypothetical protein
MPIYTDSSDNLISQITDVGRNLATRASIEGLSFKFIGWALGRGGYDPSNPVKTIPITSSDTTLIDQVHPSSYTLNYFVPSDLEVPTQRSVSCACRILRDTASANYGIGEIGIWVVILNSPVVPAEVGQLHLFSITHTPLQTITLNTAKILRIIHNF